MLYNITTVFPERVKGLHYRDNTHFIELVDRDGNVTKANATGLVRYDCKGCKALFFMLINHGPISCPTCREMGAANPTWVKPQLSFVPEGEVAVFRGGFSHEKDDPGDK